MKTYKNSTSFVIFFFFFAIFFEAFSTYAQNQKIIRGRILSQITNTPIAKASITLSPRTGNVIGSPLAFTFSNEQGNYNLNYESTDSQLVISVSHISYESQKKFITYKTVQDGLHNFMLINKPALLDSVKIKYNSPNIYKKDTLEYNASVFYNEQTRKVGDLLKQIDGFQIGIDGHITFKGKEVIALLINGDDLASNQYGLLTQNLSADFIKKIQVFNNYNRNRVLGELLPSGEVAVNLKTVEVGKRLVTGNAAAGWATNNKSLIDANVLFIKKNLKIVQLVNVNSTGKRNNTLNLNDRVTESDEIKINTGSVSAPNLPDNYLYRNEDLLLTTFAHYKINKNWKVSIRGSQLSGSYVIESKRNQLIFSSEQDRWSIFSAEQESNKQALFSGGIDIIHDNQKKFSGNITFNFSLPYLKRDFNSINKGAINDTLSQELISKNKCVSFKYDGASRLSEKMVISIKSSTEFNPFTFFFQSQTNRLNDYFKLPAAQNIFEQNTALNIFTTSTSLALVYNFQELTLKLGLQNRIQIQAPKNILNVSTPYGMRTLLVNENRKNSSEEYLFNFTLLKKFSEKIQYSFKGNTGLQYYVTQKNGVKSDLIYDLENILSYKIRPFSAITMNINVMKKLPPLSYFLMDTLITGEQTILQNPRIIKPIQYVEGKVSTTLFNIRKNAFFNSDMWFKAYLSNYYPDYLLYPGTSIMGYTPGNGDKEFGLSLSGKTFIFPLKSSVFLSTFCQTLAARRIVNLQNTLNKTNTLSASLKIVTNLKLPISTEQSINYAYTENKQANEKSILKYRYNIFELDSKITVKFFKKIYSGIAYKLISSNVGTFQIADLNITYKVTDRIRLDIRLINMLNNKRYTEKYIVPNSISVYSMQTIGRYLLTTINYSF